VQFSSLTNDDEESSKVASVQILVDGKEDDPADGGEGEAVKEREERKMDIVSRGKAKVARKQRERRTYTRATKRPRERYRSEKELMMSMVARATA
jgi:hypothetical protein